MTLNEYAAQVGHALREAYNGKGMAQINAIFQEADRTLLSNSIGDVDRKAFWDAVRKAIYAGPMLMERQANSSLIVLMQAIEQGLASRSGK